MISPMLPSIWHGFAYGLVGVSVWFAILQVARHCFRAGPRQHSRGLHNRRCYPSPSLRSGPSQVGPSLVGAQGSADCVSRFKYCFEIRDIAIESAAITTNIRGSIQCVSRLSSLPFFPRHLQAVCRIPHRAALLVPPLVRWLPMRWTKTCSPVRRLAALQVLRPAVSNWACRPATRATDLAAFERVQSPKRTIRADRLGGPFVFAFERGADV